MVRHHPAKDSNNLRRKALNVAEKICVMALLAASYDLLLGYAGIVSFAHVMFFGIGSYGVAVTLYGIRPGWARSRSAPRAGSSSRWRSRWRSGCSRCACSRIFFAMVTLAVAYAFNVLASQSSTTKKTLKANTSKPRSTAGITKKRAPGSTTNASPASRIKLRVRLRKSWAKLNKSLARLVQAARRCTAQMARDLAAKKLSSRLKALSMKG